MIVVPRIPAAARDKIARRVFCIPAARICSGNPGIARSITASVASGRVDAVQLLLFLLLVLFDQGFHGGERWHFSAGEEIRNEFQYAVPRHRIVGQILCQAATGM